jgi:RimJ/RimL family protein N-acetyltransferase
LLERQRLVLRKPSPDWDERSWETSTYERAGSHAVTELGPAIARRHWGHGYPTEAPLAVEAWAYGEREIEG